MFRSAIFALSFAASAAAAEDLDLSPILTQGLATAEASLTADDPGTQFALGGVHFLRAIERSLQLRYDHGASFEDFEVPVLRLPIPPNPNAAPFYPGLITQIFRHIDEDMGASRAALVNADTDFGVTVDLMTIWFDINSNGTQDEGEHLMDVAANALTGARGIGVRDAAPASLIVRFDTADADWLRAYTHLLSGFANLLLAFDPTEVIAEIAVSTQTMEQLRGDPSPRPLFMSPDDERFTDMFAMVYGAINRQPDAKHTRLARDHWLKMIAENQSFWGRVSLETDNQDEWLPNRNQISALGIEVPPDTGDRWLEVLNDARAVLEGELLVGHWRTSPAAGVNVAKLMENPVPVDIVSWFQGHGLLSVIERGELIDDTNWNNFERMFFGDALMFVFWLN